MSREQLLDRLLHALTRGAARSDWPILKAQALANLVNECVQFSDLDEDPQSTGRAVIETLHLVRECVAAIEAFHAYFAGEVVKQLADQTKVSSDEIPF